MRIPVFQGNRVIQRLAFAFRPVVLHEPLSVDCFRDGLRAEALVPCP